MNTYTTPATLTLRGQVKALDGDKLTLAIGTEEWPMILPEALPRPAIGQHVTALTQLAGGRSPRYNLDELPTVAVWTNHRPIKHPPEWYKAKGEA